MRRMTATITSTVVNLHARRTREAKQKSVTALCADRAGGMISSYQRDTGESQTPTAAEHTGTPHQLHRPRVPGPDVGEKWPIWKSAAFLVAYCSVAWGFIGLALWLLLR